MKRNNLYQCCNNHQTQGPMITQVVKLLVKLSSGKKHKRTQQGASAKLDRVLFILLQVSPCYYLIFASHLTQGHHVYTMCPDIIFQILLPCSRSMTSHHVTCHVTAMSHAPSSLIKIKIKRNSKEKKYKIKKNR